MSECKQICPMKDFGSKNYGDCKWTKWGVKLQSRRHRNRPRRTEVAKPTKLQAAGERLMSDIIFMIGTARVTQSDARTTTRLYQLIVSLLCHYLATEILPAIAIEALHCTLHWRKTNKMWILYSQINSVLIIS